MVEQLAVAGENCGAEPAPEGLDKQAPQDSVTFEKIGKFVVVIESRSA